MTTFRNLTPHPINIVHNGEEIVIQASAPPARVSSIAGERLAMEGPCEFYASPSWGAVQDLPDPAPGVILLVSMMVAAQCIGRADVFSPGTGPQDGAIRDEQGRIKAVTRLIQAPLR